MKVNERTLRMMKEHRKLFEEEGLTPKQIAARFDLDASTVYNCLDAIAKAEGVNRKDLLTRPSSKHSEHKGMLKPLKKVDLVSFDDAFDLAMEGIGGLQEDMKKTMKAFRKTEEHLIKEEERWN